MTDSPPSEIGRLASEAVTKACDTAAADMLRALGTLRDRLQMLENDFSTFTESLKERGKLASAEVQAVADDMERLALTFRAETERLNGKAAP